MWERDLEDDLLTLELRHLASTTEQDKQLVFIQLDDMTLIVETSSVTQQLTPTRRAVSKQRIG